MIFLEFTTPIQLATNVVTRRPLTEPVSSRAVADTTLNCDGLPYAHVLIVEHCIEKGMI